MTQTKANTVFLPNRYNIHWYTIENVLGRGGFGTTYLARDNNLDRPVAIKEYLPLQYCVRQSDHTVKPNRGQDADLYRWGLDRFLSEAQTLAKFDHANIVQVNSIFEKNNTAYMVMKFEEGRDLAVYLAKTSLKRDQQVLLNMVLPILDGLKLVHAEGFIHRDIKPANIYIRLDSSPVLLDFGSARQSVAGQSNSMTRLISKSYTPFEQYNDTVGKQGAWTDIYSLGATLYYCVTGKLPVDAMVRGVSIANGDGDAYVKLSGSNRTGYTDSFLSCIDWALAFKEADRPQSCAQWSQSLLQSGAENSLPSRRHRETLVDLPLSSPVKERKAQAQAVKRAEPVVYLPINSRLASQARQKKVRKATSPSRVLALSIVLFSVLVLSVSGHYYLQSVNRSAVRATVPLIAAKSVQVTEHSSAKTMLQPESAIAPQDATIAIAEVLAPGKELIVAQPRQEQSETLAGNITAEIIAAQSSAQKANEVNRNQVVRTFQQAAPQAKSGSADGPETQTIAKSETQQLLPEVEPDTKDVRLFKQHKTSYDPARLALLRQEQAGKTNREIIGDKLRNFIRALHKMDVPYLRSHSIFGNRTKLKIEGLARIYKASEVSVLDVNVSQGKHSAYAQLTINKLIAENGKMMVPGPAIGLYNLTISQIDGVWYDIAW